MIGFHGRFYDRSTESQSCGLSYTFRNQRISLLSPVRFQHQVPHGKRRGGNTSEPINLRLGYPVETILYASLPTQFSLCRDGELI